MRFVSLFSGIGGFDLGLERAGHECVAQVEIDPACNRVLERHWPDVPRYGDVTEVKGSDLDGADLVCGGFPCQDLSVAGRRAGLGGERSGLWWEFHRLIDEIAPRWVVIENVPGLLSSNDGRDMGIILWHLAELGYGWAYRVLDAQFFGLAQRRRRVFIVGHLGDGAAPGRVLFEPESCAGDSPPSREEGAIAAGELARSISNVGGGNDYGANKGTLVTAFAIQPDDRAGGRGALRLIPTDVSSSLTANQEAAQSDRCVRIIQQNQRGEVRTMDVAGALQAEQGMKQQNYLLPAVRRLTPTECERLQGFPDDWTAGESNTARYRMLGNAVAVPVAEWIGNRLQGVALADTVSHEEEGR